MANEKIDFYWMKLGVSNSLANYWLQLENSQNALGCPAVAIYFGGIKSEEIRSNINHTGPLEHSKISKRDWGQIKEFFTAVENNKEKSRFLVFNKGKLHILKISGDKVCDLAGDDMIKKYNDGVKENWKYKESEIIPKYIYCEVVHSKELAKIPHILATLPNSRAFSSVTFKKLEENQEKEFWHIQAARWVMNELEAMQLPKDSTELIECLSPLEFETLLFLNLHERGFHCPAWRGGTTKDIDIITKTEAEDGKTIREELGLPVNSDKSEVSFQVKRIENIKHEGPSDYTLGLTKSDETDKDKTLDAKWLIECTSKNCRSMEWLKKSLHWIGKEKLEEILPKIIKEK